MIRRLRELVSGKVDFAFETTLASRSFVAFLENCRNQGYVVTVVFLWLRAAEIAVERVATRVEAGGHSVPEAAIRRRFATGWRNFLDLYLAVSDDWQVYDSSSAAPRLIASGGRQVRTEVLDPPTWGLIERGSLDP